MASEDSESRWIEGSHSAEDVRRIVATGYDQMGERFDRWADAALGSPRDTFVARLFEEVPPEIVDSVFRTEIEVDPDDRSSADEGRWHWVVARRQGTKNGPR